MVTKRNARVFSSVLFVLGILSIFGSLFTWINSRASSHSHEEQTHAQELGNFIGLWPPTFFILSSLIDRWAEERL